jgi:choloylglycine hydrolase
MKHLITVITALVMGPLAVLRWTSKYGSLVAGSPAGAVDGINEKGLAVNMLWLGTSNFGKYDASKPSIGVGHWLQYQLDNFATVAEAVSYMKASPYQVVPGTFDELKSMVHLAIANATQSDMTVQTGQTMPMAAPPTAAYPT